MTGVIVFPDPVPAGSTPVYTAKFYDTTGKQLVLTDLVTVALTICDTNSRILVGGVSGVNILNTDRGVVDSGGNLTITFKPGDTAKVGRFAREMRSAIIDWTYGAGGAYAGKHEIQFPIVDVSPG